MDEGLPGRDRDADDAVWRDLVRRLEEDGVAGDDGGGGAADGGPAAGDGGPARYRGRPADGGGGVRPGAPDAPLGGGRGDGADGPGPSPAPPPGPRDYTADDGDDGEFVPPDPPALGFGDPLSVLAWTAVVGVPLALLVMALLWRGAPALAWGGLGVLFLAGAAFLIARMPRDRGDDGDNGARV